VTPTHKRGVSEADLKYYIFMKDEILMNHAKCDVSNQNKWLIYLTVANTDLIDLSNHCCSFLSWFTHHVKAVASDRCVCVCSF